MDSSACVHNNVARMCIATRATSSAEPYLPASTLHVFSTAPYPVVTPQPSRHTLSRGADGVITCTHSGIGEGG